MPALDRITLKGFKSIRELDVFELKRINILVGANGAGKSNFVDFFRMLRAMAEGGFQTFIDLRGGVGVVPAANMAHCEPCSPAGALRAPSPARPFR